MMSSLKVCSGTCVGLSTNSTCGGEGGGEGGGVKGCIECTYMSHAHIGKHTSTCIGVLNEYTNSINSHAYITQVHILVCVLKNRIGWSIHRKFWVTMNLH